jgi:hypothetical protein
VGNNWRKVKLKGKTSTSIYDEIGRIDRDQATRWLEKHDKGFAKHIARKRENRWKRFGL